MLDGHLRKIIDPALNSIAGLLVARHIMPNQVSWAGFGIGTIAAFLIGFGFTWTALLFLLISRLADGLDGSLAKLTRSSDYGGFLDIVLDFAFYGMIVTGFIFLDLERNGFAGAVLLLSFYVNGATFLAYAIIAEKRGLSSDVRGKKSLYFTTGLAEASETIAVFTLACLFPAWFYWLAWLFAVICFYTAISRIILAGRIFSE